MLARLRTIFPTLIAFLTKSRKANRTISMVFWNDPAIFIGNAATLAKCARLGNGSFLGAISRLLAAIHSSLR
jgi:hypothetical protein